MDFPSAVKYLKMAANLGSAEAQTQLTRLYYDGNGVEKNEIEAYAYWNLASVTQPAAKRAVEIYDKILTREMSMIAQERTRLIKEVIEDNIRTTEERVNRSIKQRKEAELNRRLMGA